MAGREPNTGLIYSTVDRQTDGLSVCPWPILVLTETSIPLSVPVPACFSRSTTFSISLLTLFDKIQCLSICLSIQLSLCSPIRPHVLPLVPLPLLLLVSCSFRVCFLFVCCLFPVCFPFVSLLSPVYFLFVCCLFPVPSFLFISFYFLFVSCLFPVCFLVISCLYPVPSFLFVSCLFPVSAHLSVPRSQSTLSLCRFLFSLLFARQANKERPMKWSSARRSQWGRCELLRNNTDVQSTAE